MLQRFGLLCWWAGNAGAAACIAFDVIEHEVTVLPFQIAFAVAVWLAGRALLFLLAAR